LNLVFNLKQKKQIAYCILQIAHRFLNKIQIHNYLSKQTNNFSAKKPTISTTASTKEKTENLYLSTGGNQEDILEESSNSGGNKPPSQTPKGAGKIGGAVHLRNTSDVFKAEAFNKTAVSKKDGPTPFNVNTTTKPLNNPLRQSIRKQVGEPNLINSEKEPPHTKEFDLNQNSQSYNNRKGSANALSAAGASYQNTQNSEKNFVDAPEDGEENGNLEYKKANSGAITSNKSTINF